LPELPATSPSAASERLTAHRRYGYPLREIADHLGVHYSTVGRRLNAWEETDPTEPFPPDV